MIYLALGDSITYGYDATHDGRKYVDLLTRKLAERRRTHSFVQAKPGYTAAQLARSLDRVPECILREAALTTLMIGGNDLLRTMPWYLRDPVTATERLDAQFRPYVHEILGKATGIPQSPVLLCTVYNPFPKWEVAATAVAALNTIIADIGRSRGCVIVPVHERMRGQEARCIQDYRNGDQGDFRIVGNPIHPNDEGHACIADAIFDVYRSLHVRRRKPGNGLHARQKNVKPLRQTTS